MSGAPLLLVSGLSVGFDTIRGRVEVIDQVSFAVDTGEIVGVVGESGSGKSVTALAIMGLLGEQGHIEKGSIALAGTELTRLDRRAWRRLRGREIGMIFQEPATCLNPLFPVGFQIAEVLVEHEGLGAGEAHKRAIALMDRVGIPAAAQRVDDYPHQMSGGMKQRVMIAMALACGPKLLIADEPTTALDVTIQAQILDLIREINADLGMSVLLITHDMGVVAEMADRVLVMYAGRIVEEAAVGLLFEAPGHPYSRLLLHSIPRVTEKRLVLPTIDGTTPSPASMPSGCRFHPRCPDAIARCRAETPILETTRDGRRVACWRHDEHGLVSERAEALA